ncbi:hypothetical protein VHUM_02404 [Vanrija humicola]|uniref:Deacetylase sirtuin-type domain-containing protein n=1 Tax=Vanrija humicola TaxID=5417 RepID=A0A7D8UZ82_VANHU|nr:hypothetical protein VHUM_02404 [Vanrija humicola]
MLADVNIKVAKAKKVIVVSGAGISCSSGIPDFRSADGLYAMVKEKYPDAFVSGKELFSSGLFNNPATTSIFYTFIAELSLACQAAQPTRTHHFIHRLETKGKLLRSYTQNVDGFERRMGIESGGRGNGLKKIGTRNVELHGDLGRVRCVLCFADYEARDDYVEMFREGEAPHCPACEDRCAERVNRSARATSIGTLRPSIVLYDEPHPLGDEIGALQAHDMRRGPDVLLIMGTSLKVHGLKRLVKDFAKTVHEKKGVVVFVNATAPSKEWDSVIDYHIEGETDSWVERVEEDWKKVRPQDWEIQTVLDGEVVHKSVAKGKGKAKPKCGFVLGFLSLTRQTSPRSSWNRTSYPLRRRRKNAPRLRRRKRRLCRPRYRRQGPRAPQHLGEPRHAPPPRLRYPRPLQRPGHRSSVHLPPRRLPLSARVSVRTMQRRSRSTRRRRGSSRRHRRPPQHLAAVTYSMPPPT